MATLSRIAPEIPVLSLPEALEYYQQKLGFSLTMQMPGGDYAIVERDGIAIHLFEARMQLHSPAAIHIFTNQLDELHTELQNRGAQLVQGIVRKPWATVTSACTTDTGT